jgi:hypothetical protein
MELTHKVSNKYKVHLAMGQAMPHKEEPTETDSSQMCWLTVRKI